MTVLIQRGTGAPAYVPPELVRGRLSLQSGVKIPTFDQVGKSTVYYTGGRTSVYSGSAWVRFALSELSDTLSSLTSGALYDYFLDYHATTPFLTRQIWAGHGQALTGATNATPIVITANSHGLNNGDEVYIEGVRGPSGSSDAYPQVAPNGTWIVASATTNTFALTGSVGSFTYLRGGCFSARLAAHLLGTQDDEIVKAVDHTRRYLGTCRATSTTTTEDSRAKRFLWNAHSQVELPLLKFDYGDAVVNNVTDGESGYSLWAVGGAGSSRVEFIQGLTGGLLKVNVRCGISGASPGHVPIQIGLDATPRREFTTANNVFHANGNSHIQVSTTNGTLFVQNGYHTIDIMYAELGPANCTLLQGSTTGTVWA